jgi:hypothetical protein
MQTIEAVCPDCLGEVWTDPCRRCFGAGTVLLFRYEPEEIKGVDIWEEWE